ncbi:MAG: FkbM family methyltransferase [Lentisphaerae bacterium]|nr:FkbM family methyltransferase [Lentisphaerota bacterium]
MRRLLDNAKSRTIATYRKLGDGPLKQLIKNVASFVIHGLSFQVEEVTIDDQVVKLYRNRLLPVEQLVLDVAGYNLHSPLQRGQAVVDVGAYTGLYAIYAALKVGPEGLVIAFEPDPYNRMMLKRNVRLNKVKNVVCSSKGLYSKEGTIAFDVQGVGSHVVEDDAKQIAVNHVRVTTLDAELRQLNIPTVDFVKMDVEGTELETLKGCVHTITAASAIEFAVASYHIVDGQETAQAVETFFRSHGLESYSAYPEHLTTFGYRH